MMLQVEMNGYRRIRKDEARRMYDDGAAIYVLPCKVRPDDNHMWIRPCEMDGRPFNKWANEFEYYNCNAELGYYAAYYIREE